MAGYWLGEPNFLDPTHDKGHLANYVAKTPVKLLEWDTNSLHKLLSKVRPAIPVWNGGREISRISVRGEAKPRITKEYRLFESWYASGPSTRRSRFPGGVREPGGQGAPLCPRGE
jgi:hypothetical protein